MLDLYAESLENSKTGYAVEISQEKYLAEIEQCGCLMCTSKITLISSLRI